MNGGKLETLVLDLESKAPKLHDTRENPEETCVYHAAYSSGHNSTGPFAKETVTLTSTTDKVVNVEDYLFGCGNENNFHGNNLGVIGLGRGPLSLVSQMAPYVGGKKFSHCFMADPNIESKIYFGNGSEVLGEGVLTEPMAEPNEEQYKLIISGITIENDFVPFNSTGTMNKKANMLVDSGTPLSRLPQDFFDRVITQLNNTVKLESFMQNGGGLSNIYFNYTTLPKLPTVALEFESGGKLQLNENQLFQIDEKRKAFCFMMMNNTYNFMIFGGTLQTDFLIGFDLDRKVVSFKPTNCANFNKN
ncbi:putative nepenthesin [Rosa chinensis]|uniref:Putative nepenthesin n=2 Tax=Rosa chinensis TaxID=74649 RepID=A0A2P6R5V0_ROSCH|nr:putative nepenthesin [Rosa chinensis]